MMYEHYDFTRNPIVEDHVFFLESKCIRCGFTVLAPSVEELVEAGKNIGRNAHQPCARPYSILRDVWGRCLKIEWPDRE